MTSELEPGNRARITAAESARMIARAARLLPAGHGQITARVESGFYSAELMGELVVAPVSLVRMVMDHALRTTLPV